MAVKKPAGGARLKIGGDWATAMARALKKPKPKKPRKKPKAK